jgi:acyl carrier protein
MTNPSTPQQAAPKPSLWSRILPGGRAGGDVREPLSPAAVQGWLVERLAAYLEIPEAEVDVETPFAEYGLDSRAGVSLAGDLETLIGRELPPTLVWDHPTIRAVVAFVTAPSSTERAAV